MLFVFFITACNDNNKNGENDTSAADESTNDYDNQTSTETSELTSNINDEQSTEETLEYNLPYKTRELSRDGNYKIMEMYVYDDNDKVTRRITFEIPADWLGTSSVFTNGEDYKYTLKVDMWSVKSITREDVLTEFNERNGEFVKNVKSENIYLTENYEIFQYKYNSAGGDANCIYVYYFYANGECFYMTGYIFGEDKPEYDDIVKRIAESVRFQF